MKTFNGPQFLRFFIPIIDVLKELGGSGTSSEVTDLVIEKLDISEKEQRELLKSGVSRVRNQVAFSRLYLVKTGFLDSSKRGVWTLTGKGRKANITEKDLMKFFREVQALFKKDKNIDIKSSKKEIEINDNSKTLEFVDSPSTLLNILQNLPPDGFERLCQRLLRESGFEQVKVTGRSGDGGIDGIGILQINPFVSFRVLFQSKRYKGTVSASQIRDFRGAMIGRADKGIIITTGSFTTEAKKEARRDGADPIELVDGDKLIEMFEKLELGVKPKKVFEIDEDFFTDYKK